MLVSDRAALSRIGRDQSAERFRDPLRAEAADGGRSQPLLEYRVLAQRRGERHEAVLLDDVPVHPHGRNSDSRQDKPDKYRYGRDKSAHENS